MTIQLQTNPSTGKKDILVSLRSDEDATPMEHEQQHRALVEKLLDAGIVAEEELGKIVIEREEEAGNTSQSRKTQGAVNAEARILKEG